MNEIGVLGDGAVLIHNGVIVEAGPARRIENLQQSRNAREIDAAGKLVMPAFVDPDAVLVSPPAGRVRDEGPGLALSVLSRKRLEVCASGAAMAMARAGVLSIGAHTGNATDLRETTKSLLIHQGLQNRPLRIRSILSPRHSPEATESIEKELIEKWIPAGRKRKLASILELTAGEVPEISKMRRIATAGASGGYSLRIRSDMPLDDDGHQLAVQAGAVAIVAPPSEQAEFADKLAAVGCVHVLRAEDALRDECEFAAATRLLIDRGATVGLASGYSSVGCATSNPQFVLYLAASRFGMSAEEAICATTWNAACSLRMSHVTGSLEPGKSADLLIMDVHDYRELGRRAGHNDILVAMRAGQTIYRRGAVAALD
jgi:imidazolonepropionase